MFSTRSFWVICVGLGLFGPALQAAQPGVAAEPNPDARGLEPSGGSVAIPAGKEQAIVGLLASVGFAEPLEGGFTFSDIQIDRATVIIGLKRLQAGGEGALAAQIRLDPVSQAKPGETTSKSFVIRPTLTADEPTVQQLVNAAVASIVEHDQGDIYAGVFPDRSNDGVMGEAHGVLDGLEAAGSVEPGSIPVAFWLKLLFLLVGGGGGLYWLLTKLPTLEAAIAAPSDRDVSG